MLLNQRKFIPRPSIKAPASSFQQFITFVEPERILQQILSLHKHTNAVVYFQKRACTFTKRKPQFSKYKELKINANPH
jgi:hypothetical protein